MIIDWDHFTPLTAIIGGGLLGLATAIFILICGRILGISGIIGGLLKKESIHNQDIAWRLRFVLGLLLAPLVYYSVTRDSVPIIESSNLIITIAGLLVGAGTTIGSGCTSGHGICGLSRFSPRSLMATIIFIGFGILTVFVMRHIL